MRDDMGSSALADASDEATFLEVSPFEADGGEKVGKDPRKIPTGRLRDLGHPETPIKAIRAKCLDCVSMAPEKPAVMAP